MKFFAGARSAHLEISGATGTQTKLDLNLTLHEKECFSQEPRSASQHMAGNH